MSVSNGFTENADLYRSSLAHLQVEDLESALVDLPDLLGLTALDVATGTGHTAFFLSEKGCHTFAVDVNDEMLKVAEEESDKKSLSIRFLKCPVEDLFFDDEGFDLVTCRLAAHHFMETEKFVSEAVRVLKQGGHLLLVDNVVPDDDSETAGWLNRFEKARDPDHKRCLSAAEWVTLLERHGFQILRNQRFEKTLNFTDWMARMSQSQEFQSTAWADLISAPNTVLDYWKPEDTAESGKQFVLQRQVIVAQLGD